MILISYDIKDDKLRTRFSKFILRFGYRMQYSVYSITNSDRILDNIISEINNNYMKKFQETDSVMIIKLSKTCELIRMGYCRHEDEEMVIV